MPTPSTPWGDRALEILSDGAWHPCVELVDAMTSLIPPGRAFRRGEVDRNRRGQRPDGPGPRVRGTDESSLTVGARRLAKDQLYALCRYPMAAPRCERALVDGVDSLRIASAQSRAS